MNLVVSDASPINVLVRIGLIDLLPTLFHRVVIPPSVRNELSRHETPRSVHGWIINAPAWLSVATPSVAADPSVLRHRGELDAIQLAVDLNATMLLDDNEARHLAAKRGVAFVGTVGVLELAAANNLIADLAATHDALRATDFRISESILNDSLTRHRASRK